MGLSYGLLGHAPGVGLGGTGVKNFFPKFNQIWCVSYLHEWHMQRHNCLGPHPWGLWEGPKGQISLNLNYKVNFKDFFVSDIKHIRLDFHWTTWVGLGGIVGVGGFNFFL